MKDFGRIFKFILYALLVIGLIVLFFQINPEEIRFHLNLVDSKYLIIGMACQILTMVLLGVQWSAMVEMAGFNGSFLQCFLMNAVGNVADAANPGVKVGGELFRYDQLKKRFKMEPEDSVLVVALQKIISISAFSILTLISVVYIVFNVDGESTSVSPILVSMFIFGILVVVLAYGFLKPGVFDGLIFSLNIKEETKDRILIFLKNYYETLRRFKSDKYKVFRQFLLAVFIWIFYGVKLYVVCIAFEVEINVFMIGAITYISYMIGMIPLLPGSVGSFEGGMIALFGLTGVGPALALSISVVFRIVTFWFEFAFCGLVLIVERILRDGKGIFDRQRKY